MYVKKKKKKTGSTHHHKTKKKGRVGAINIREKDTQDAILFVLAALGANWLTNLGTQKLQAAFPSIDPKYMNWGTGLVESGAGVYGLLHFKEAWQKGAAVGVAMAGGNVLEKQLGLLSGIGYINLLPQQNMGAAPLSYRQVPRLGTLPPDAFRQPKTVGRPNFRPNMTSVYAAGGGY
jgi:hypothetical protein